MSQVCYVNKERNTGMKAGRDYIGVGVGAMVFDGEGHVFLAQRGARAKNERGCWEFPGGAVEYGERLADAVQREFLEEYELVIEVGALLHVVDHLLPDEGQHWISPTYLARHVGGVARIVEPEKCSAIGWFGIDRLPSPLSLVTQEDLRVYLESSQAV
jgi:ADP-ribose pyrophosphatase YjhB (NUDIX family)